MKPTIFEPRLKFKPRLKFFKFGLRLFNRLIWIKIEIESRLHCFVMTTVSKTQFYCLTFAVFLYPTLRSQLLKPWFCDDQQIWKYLRSSGVEHVPVSRDRSKQHKTKISFASLYSTEGAGRIYSTLWLCSSSNFNFLHNHGKNLVFFLNSSS